MFLVRIGQFDVKPCNGSCLTSIEQDQNKIAVPVIQRTIKKSIFFAKTSIYFTIRNLAIQR
ncbi:MAG: hypothetical protein ACK53Y_08495, partial [bacterium]